MDDTNDTEVSAVLLSFGILNKAQRSEFVNRFNTFIYCSPQKRRRLLDHWLNLCRDSKNPSIQMVAESAESYMASEKKTRR